MIVIVGSVNRDEVATVGRFPAPGETVLASAFEVAHGGKGANQAVAAVRQGASVCFIGAVGPDEAGADAIASLREEGVDTSRIAIGSEPTGTAIVVVDDRGENRIIVGAGANRQVAIDAGTREVISAADVVMCQLEIPVDAVIAAAESTAGTFILNAAPARRLPTHLSELTDVLIVNESELRMVAGSTEPTAVRAIGIETVVTTLGERGAHVVTPDDVAFVAAPQVSVIDTTGAGDTFCGTFAAALDAGNDLFEATHRGVVAGSLATTKLGARTAMPNVRQVELAMRRRP